VDGSARPASAQESIREIRINQNRSRRNTKKLGYGKIEIFTARFDKYVISAVESAHDF
jgi:hypothetical protein